MPNSELFFAPLRNQEAVISSRMEGTISSIDDILKFEADNNDINSENISNTRSETIETFLYGFALSNAQEALSNGYPLSQHMIKRIHQELLSFGRGKNKSPGQYKNKLNYIVDKTKNQILFIPISPEKLNDGLENLFEYLKSSEHSSLLKTALMHIEFEALHPFEDGNGRIGRMLITLFLWHAKAISEPCIGAKTKSAKTKS